MEDSLKQYIELFESNRQEIDAHSAPALNAAREHAAATLRKMRLPRLGEENFEVTDLPSILAPDYGLNINRYRLNVNLAATFRCGVPKMSTALFFMENDIFSAPADLQSHLPEGVEVCSLREIAEKEPRLVEKYYNHIADNDNPIVALSSLLAQDGVWIRIRRGVKAKCPLQLVNLLGGAERLMAVRRIVIVAEEDSDAKLLVCDHTNMPEADETSLMALQTIEIFAEKNSHFEFYDLEETNSDCSRLSTLWLSQEGGSCVIVNGLTLFNGRTRNEYHCRFAAPGSELKLCGMAIADGHRLIDNYSRVDHDAPHCNTTELFKYSVDDEARGSFNGLIRVAYGAEKTEAYQSNRNLVGSETARMYSKPQLEIYNDDVKCSHGSATGQLDEMQIFYMRTRGLDLEEARLLLKQAFMADVVNMVEIPGLRERLTSMVERRFAGERSACHACGLC